MLRISRGWAWNGEKKPWNSEKETWGSQWNGEKNSRIRSEAIQEL